MESADYHWNGDGLLDEATERGWERLVRAALFFQQELKKTVGKVNPPPYTSTPKGDPPRVRTAFGRDNILVEYDRQHMAVRIGVGVNAKYMAFQELSKRLNHPWLLPTLKRLKDKLRSILAGGKA